MINNEKGGRAKRRKMNSRKRKTRIRRGGIKIFKRKKNLKQSKLLAD